QRHGQALGHGGLADATLGRCNGQDLHGRFFVPSSRAKTCCRPADGAAASGCGARARRASGEGAWSTGPATGAAAAGGCTCVGATAGSGAATGAGAARGAGAGAGAGAAPWVHGAEAGRPCVAGEAAGGAAYSRGPVGSTGPLGAADGGAGGGREASGGCGACQACGAGPAASPAHTGGTPAERSPRAEIRGQRSRACWASRARVSSR